MSYFVALLQMKDKELNTKFRQDHLDYLGALQEAGKILKKGPFEDGSGGMVIYIAETFEEAKKLAEEDPYIVLGARTLDLRQWHAS